MWNLIMLPKNVGCLISILIFRHLITFPMGFSFFFSLVCMYLYWRQRHIYSDAVCENITYDGSEWVLYVCERVCKEISQRMTTKTIATTWTDWCAHFNYIFHLFLTNKIIYIWNLNQIVVQKSRKTNKFNLENASDECIYGMNEWMWRVPSILMFALFASISKLLIHPISSILCRTPFLNGTVSVREWAYTVSTMGYKLIDATKGIPTIHGHLRQ